MKSKKDEKRRWLLCSALSRTDCFLIEWCWQTRTWAAPAEGLKGKAQSGQFWVTSNPLLSVRATHLDRTSCSGWSPGCSHCGTDRCRNRKSWRSDPSPRTVQRRTHSHLQQETESDSGGQKEKGSNSRQHCIPALFTFQSPDFGSNQRGPWPSGGWAEPRPSPWGKRTLQRGSFLDGYCAVVKHHGTSQHKQTDLFHFMMLGADISLRGWTKLVCPLFYCFYAPMQLVCSALSLNPGSHRQV